MLKKNVALALFTCLFIQKVQSQDALPITDAATRWADSFVEWEFSNTYFDSAAERSFTEKIGKMALRWPNRNLWTEWDFELGGTSGTIKQKWKNDPSFWELRADDDALVTMQMRWPGDPSEWKITDRDGSELILKARYTNQADEWLIRDDRFGQFYAYTLREGDPRDWAIEDDLDPKIGQSTRLACLFLALFHACPKE